MNVVLYSNCAGNIIQHMFNSHTYTRDKFIIHYIINYEQLDKNMTAEHKQLLESCDIFLYQPFNQHYSYSEYDIEKVKQLLKPTCLILRINYYRFKGFWFESDYKPYNEYCNYKFLDYKYYGLHKDFINFVGDRAQTRNKIKNINIDRTLFLEYFQSELDQLKLLDDNSDVKMYDYFITNYKHKHLFHDVFHPTNLFFYEIFRQIVLKLTGHELLYEDMDFIHTLNDIEMTHWALPILPQIKGILDMTTPNSICVFYPGYADRRIYMDVYDYYYLRQSHENFALYLSSIA